MPITKPTQLYDWAEGPSTPSPVVTPVPSGKMAQGWVDSEYPPAEYFNWLMKGYGEWIEWLNAFEVQTHVWTATQEFTPTSNSNAMLKGIVSHVATTYSLIGEFGDSVAGGCVRTYYTPTTGSDANFALIINAKWNEGLSRWVPDIAGTCSRLNFDPIGGLQLFTNPGAGNFSDVQWAPGGLTFALPGLIGMSPIVDPAVLVGGDGQIWFPTDNGMKCYDQAGTKFRVAGHDALSTFTYDSGSGWADSGAGGSPPFAGFYKDGTGRVWLSGMMTNSNNNPANTGHATICSTVPIPAGYRPLRRFTFTVPIHGGGNFCKLDVQTNGVLTLVDPNANFGGGNSIDIEGISWQTF